MGVDYDCGSLIFIPLEDAYKSICVVQLALKTVPYLWSTVGRKCKDLPPLPAILQIYVLHFWVGHKPQMAFILFLVVRSS